jgi:sterol 3beta-glucosyltransferase
MKIFINTFGTRGDVQPYVALGKGLKEAGHTVTICTASTYEPFIIEQGLNYGYMTDELLKLVDTDIGRDALEETVGLWGTAKTMFKMVKLAKPLNRQMVVDSWEAAKIAEPELVIYHAKALGAVSIAEKFNAPVIMANLQPMIAPTTEFPPIGIPDLNIGGWYNKMTYKAIEMGYRSYTKDVNEVRRDMMGLDNFPKSSGILNTSDGSPIPMLHAFSQHVIPQPVDWPEQYTVNGYWFLDRDDDWQPSAELQAFLDAGEPPVYVGFGSMAGKNPQRLSTIVINALQQANVRGIIATGWGGLDAFELPETIFKIEQAPHDWLFERVTGVVHHGGAGTTAAGLRAGRPTVICPFMGDQPFWGKRVEKLGVGVKTSSQKKLKTEELAVAIRTVTTNRDIQEKAAALGEKIKAEDGVANAISTIDKIVKNYKKSAA